MYVIENDINFYEAIKEIEDTHDDEAPMCLISNTPLQSDHISLACGHKFNYEPLFNDISNHKNKFNILEKKTLNITEIRCPYCRTIHNELLPYNSSFPKIHGVNYFDETIYLNQLNKKYHIYIKGKCGFNSQHYYNDEHSTETVLPVCNDIIVTYIDLFKTHFCNYHKNICINQYIQHKKKLAIIEKQKIKEDLKLQKQKIKDDLKLQKQQDKLIQKQKIKEDSILQKQNIPQCSIILQKGKNKGCVCSFKSIENTLFCKKHQPVILV